MKHEIREEKRSVHNEACVLLLSHETVGDFMMARLSRELRFHVGGGVFSQSG